MCVMLHIPPPFFYSNEWSLNISKGAKMEREEKKPVNNVMKAISTFFPLDKLMRRKNILLVLAIIIKSRGKVFFLLFWLEVCHRLLPSSFFPLSFFSLALISSLQDLEAVFLGSHPALARWGKISSSLLLYHLENNFASSYFKTSIWS